MSSKSIHSQKFYPILFYHLKKPLYQLYNTILQYSQHPNFYFPILLIKIIFLHNKIIYLTITIIYNTTHYFSLFLFVQEPQSPPPPPTTHYLPSKKKKKKKKTNKQNPRPSTPPSPIINTTPKKKHSNPRSKTKLMSLHPLPKSLHHQTHCPPKSHLLKSTHHHPPTQNRLLHKSQPTWPTQPTQPNTNPPRSPSLTTAKPHNLHPQTQQKFMKTRMLNSLLGSSILLKLERSGFATGKLEGSWFCRFEERGSSTHARMSVWRESDGVKS